MLKGKIRKTMQVQTPHNQYKHTQNYTKNALISANEHLVKLKPLTVKGIWLQKNVPGESGKNEPMQ